MPKNIHTYCSRLALNLCDSELCEICQDGGAKTKTIICCALEPSPKTDGYWKKAQGFKGRCTHSTSTVVLSPLDGIGRNKLKIKEFALLGLQGGKLQEIIR